MAERSAPVQESPPPGDRSSRRRRGAGNPPAGGRLRTVAVAGAILAIVIGSGFAVQALSLGRANADAHILVEVVAKLEQYHRSRARMVVAGESLTSVCTQYWSRSARGATVSLSDGRVLREIRDRLRSKGQLAEGEFELAGCPRELTVMLATELKDGAAIRVAQTRYRGRLTYTVSFPTARVKVSIVLPHSGGLPIGVRFEGRGFRGSSRVSYGHGVIED